jgi:uncharacterized protein YbjT (DUF2867 family)
MATLQKPTVLVLGASGQIGRFVVQQLDQTPEEVHVRVAARTPERCLALQQEGRDAVLLDLDQPNTFATALRGVDRVFLLTGYSVAMLVQSKAFVDAAKKARVQHIVHLVACRSEVVTDEGAFHKFISIAALHTATEHLACPLTLSLRQATRGVWALGLHRPTHRMASAC